MKVSTVIKRIEKGEPFTVDFEKRSLNVNGSFVKDIEFELPDNPEERLLELFRNYKYSVPSTKANSKYFYACEENQLSTSQLVENESRYIARAKLEIYVLGLIINSKWDFGDKWYWQSKTEPKLVLFSKWFNK